MATTARPKPSKPTRRWFQFSLRTLLLGMTLFAVWLGFWTLRARKQKEAVDTFRRPGVTVGYDSVYVEQSSYRPKIKRSSPAWLKNLVGIDFFDSVTTLWITPDRDLPGQPITDADLEHLAAFPYLESLIINSEEVTDSGLVHLRNLPRLKELFLGAPRVTDRGLTHLKSLEELRYLQLNCCVTDRGLAKLAALKKLEELKSYGVNPPRQIGRAFAALDQPSWITGGSTTGKVPLEVFLDHFATLYATRIELDEEILKAANVAANPEVDFITRKIPLDAALTRALQPHGLMWEVTPDGILVTTQGVVDSDLAGVARLKKSLPNLKKVRVCVDWKG